MSEPDIEKGAALAAALDQLFVQYPTGIGPYLEWRQQAVIYAIVGNASLAFYCASGTGVPDDVLNALRGSLM